ncbi:MAG: hypothetical protein ACO2O2_06880 [Acidilobaceae archaeon]
MGELSKTVWEVATVLWPNSRYLSFGGERINGYSPLVIRTAVRGAWLPGRRWEPHGVGLDRGP